MDQQVDQNGRKVDKLGARKCKEPEEIGLPNHVSLVHETVSKVVAQNAGEAALPYHQDLVCSKTNVAWSHINLGLVGPIE
ncbi:hypothetical protein ACTXT7_007482 [Hymenolepis weldensis]